MESVLSLPPSLALRLWLHVDILLRGIKGFSGKLLQEAYRVSCVDLTVVVHECGHGFQSQTLEQYLCSDSSRACRKRWKMF